MDDSLNSSFPQEHEENPEEGTVNWSDLVRASRDRNIADRNGLKSRRSVVLQAIKGRMKSKRKPPKKSKFNLNIHLTIASRLVQRQGKSSSLGCVNIYQTYLQTKLFCAIRTTTLSGLKASLKVSLIDVATPW